MPATTCLISTDCASATVFAGSEDHTFSTPAIEGEPNAAQLQRRAIELAAWAAKLPPVRRRLPLLCLDVEDTTCAWLRAPSRMPQVLAASFRNLMQEWGDAAAGQSIIPLDDRLARAAKKPAFTLLPQRKKTNTPESAVRAAVLCQPDALARIMLGALDKLGVRPHTVTTLWHAAAAAWTKPDDPFTAVIVERAPGRYLWVWSADDTLIAAGHLRAALAHDEDNPHPSTERAIAQRLTVDFTAWATHLGRTPHRITVVSPNPAPLARELAAATNGHPPPIEIATPNPVRDTLERATEAPSQSRRALAVASLTNRPTRAARKRYQLTAATLLIAAIAAGGFGYRISSAAGQHKSQATLTKNGNDQRIFELNDPEIVGPSFTRTLDARVVILQKKPSLKPPPKPKPIMQELTVVLDTIREFEDVKIRQVTIDSGRQSNLTLTVPDRKTGTDIMVQLQSVSTNIAWERDSRHSNRNEQQASFVGTWKRQSS